MTVILEKTSSHRSVRGRGISSGRSGEPHVLRVPLLSEGITLRLRSAEHDSVCMCGLLCMVQAHLPLIVSR